MSADPAVRTSRYPDVRSARSWLFVPGDRGDRCAKAAESGADVVVCDLEDAVAAEAKASARTEVARWLVQAAAATAAGLGFGGKLCIHPRQVDAVHAGFRPGAEEVRRLDGQMLDRPVVERARQVLRRAGTGPGGPGESRHDMSNAT